jgi:hypothetical protein
MLLVKELAMKLLIAPLACVLLCLAGCRDVYLRSELAGPAQHESQAIERDGAKLLHATLHMGAGNLRVGMGTEKLVRADFDYNMPSLKPRMSYTSGELTISQPETHGLKLGNHRYEWDIRLNREVPVDLNVNFGAGDARLDVGSLDLHRVRVEMGVGQLQMDLRGQTRHDYDVNIQGGVGEATVYLPSDAGVYAEASGGIGEITAAGMHKDGSRYTNDLYQKARYTVRLNVQGGVGSIHLIAE